MTAVVLLLKTHVSSYTRRDGVHVPAHERRPMYVSRKVLNGHQVHAWAVAAGFKGVVPPEKMHVTVAYSKTPVHHASVAPHQDSVAAEPVHVTKLGDDGDHVLRIDHETLHDRFRHMLNLGASWDFDTDNYQPHVTISYKPQDSDMSGIEPFPGEILLGPEIVEDLKSGWGKKVTEEAAAAAPQMAKAILPEFALRPIAWRGLTLVIENEAGSLRSGVGPGGQPWETVMPFPYGYAKDSEGVDGDEVDIYVGPDLETCAEVYVVHQRRAGDWERYDEDKCMLGFSSEDAAREAYLRQYDDPRFLGPITAMPVEEFVEKVKATRERPAMIKTLLFLPAG